MERNANMSRKRVLFASLLTVPLALSACGGGSTTATTSGGSTAISYWLWDASQQPAYQQCATDFHTRHQILPLDDLIKKDNVNTNIYQPGLAALWVGSDGHRYGLPKDWDTIGVFYNKKYIDVA